MRKFLRALWARCLILRARCLIEAGYRAQGSWGIFSVPFAAFAVIAGLIACAFLGIGYWFLFVSGLLFLSFGAYFEIQFLLVADSSFMRMELMKRIPKMKSRWILKERNAEIRKLITENLGWPKILSDLQGEFVDRWNEYELYRIQPKDRLMRESFYLLKMRCPSTGSDFTLCVPPQIRKAKEAITWVRKGIAPEDFIKQT